VAPVFIKRGGGRGAGKTTEPRGNKFVDVSGYLRINCHGVAGGSRNGLHSVSSK
jgi:hypothetical protein